jgi:YHS domain-containing protein
LCCDKCLAAFGKNPGKFIAKLSVFAKAPGAAVPAPVNKVCPVSGKSVDAAHTSTYQGRLIGFCCAKCKTSFDQEPGKFRAKLADLFEK